MAFGTERTTSAVHVDKLPDETQGSARVGSVLARWWANQPIPRFVAGTLLRRILVSSLLGLAVFILGILLLSNSRGWLIDAKRESLRIQGEIIAAAIAGDAKVETERLTLDPNKLPEAADSRIPFRDDGFAALELSIRPERVAPILRRLIQPTNTRARIYARDGTLIVDSDKLLQRGTILKESESDDDDDAANGRVKTKNFWTRFNRWVLDKILDKQLPVYREIGSNLGTNYPEVRIAMAGGTPTPMVLLSEKGEQIVSLAVPIQRMKSVHGVLLLSTRPGEIDEIVGEDREKIFIMALIALIATISTSVLLARTVAGPIRHLAETAEIVSNDINAQRELPAFPNRRDEVGLLARAFAKMTAALFRRLEASERFAADVAHELKNPLTAARSTAESLAFAKTEEQRNQLIEQIQLELKRLNKMITEISSASRLDAELARQIREPVPLVALLESVTSILSDKAADHGATLDLQIPPAKSPDTYTIYGNDTRIAQVITNLVDNAISFSPNGGKVAISALRDGREVEIRVDDDGPGIDEDLLERVFARFYTYRPTAESSRGNNSGLGLNISREIVTAYGGTIRAENRYKIRGDKTSKRIGARFVVRLPVTPTHRRSA
ncbi:MAG: stimulus-sensing domain-containing protein [Hyphomicrobiaceae bacterium]|nr:stimulus-sensing domain-containing protein [Hyphomicrobiaceae bacterium]